MKFVRVANPYSIEAISYPELGRDCTLNYGPERRHDVHRGYAIAGRRRLIHDYVLFGIALDQAAFYIDHMGDLPDTPRDFTGRALDYGLIIAKHLDFNRLGGAGQVSNQVLQNL